jgi:hypothetical protein
MQSKYKSLGSKTLLALILVLALLTGWLAEGAVRAVAWTGAAVFVFLLARPARLAQWFPVAILLLGTALLLIDHADTDIWIWVLPLCLLGLTGRAGVMVNVAAYLLCVIYIGWTQTLPTATVAAISLAAVWLLSLERQRLSVTNRVSTKPDWLLPPAQLDTDIQRELKRAEREGLHGEVVVFGCARSTSADMKQLCRCLQGQLALYERAYRLNDYGVAVILVAPCAEAASQRRQQLIYAIAPHREVSSTPLTEIGDRFAPYPGKPATRISEMQSWH